MYSHAAILRLNTTEDMVYGKSKTIDRSLSIQARVKDLFLTVFGHARSSTTLKLARTTKKRRQSNRNRSNKKRRGEAIKSGPAGDESANHRLAFTPHDLRRHERPFTSAGGCHG
jgi:hypothetical protein